MFPIITINYNWPYTQAAAKRTLRNKSLVAYGFIMTSFDEAFCDDHSPSTGCWSDQVTQTAVLKSIHELTRQTMTKFWFGKTSNGKEGCRKRWNSKYKEEGMTRIAMVYQSHIHDSALNMEAHLIGMLADDILNGTGGVGKPAEGRKPYTVYIAWKD